MKRLIVLILALVLLAVPVAAQNGYVCDDSGLLTQDEVAALEKKFATLRQERSFTLAVLTADTFGGISAEEFAGSFYDIQGYSEDGMLLLVSLEQGEWYLLTNGRCARLIPDSQAAQIGEDIVPLIQSGQYYAAFLAFADACAEAMESADAAQNNQPNAPAPGQEQEQPVDLGAAVKTVGICMLIGLAIGGVVMLILATKMRTVKPKANASDYMVPGSMNLRFSRDIYLYSTVSRTPRPKNNSSGSSGGSSGGSRGGAGGRL